MGLGANDYPAAVTPERTAVTPTSTTAPRKLAPPTPTRPGCDVPSGVTSRQVVLLDAYGSGATIRACERNGFGVNGNPGLGARPGPSPADHPDPLARGAGISWG